MSRINLSTPDVGDLEAEYASRAITSGWAAPAGPDLLEFEDEVAARLGVQHAVALSSGTAALHLALVASNIGAGDVVITSTMTFVATANAIIYTGAEPYFVDSDRDTGNVNVELVRTAAARIRSNGRRVGAIVPVDLLGKCVELGGLLRLADELGVPLIVDSAESMGSYSNGRPAGSFGDASILSFNGNKIMTTGGGGMLVTNTAVLADRVRYLATQAKQSAAHYEHTELGYNYRLSNILAAVGRAQLLRLDAMLARRRYVRGRYRALVDRFVGVSIFQGIEDEDDNCWLTAIIMDETSPFSAAQLSGHLTNHDIESRPLWKPMHLQPVFASHQSSINGNSQWLFEHGLTLPSGSKMSDRELSVVLDTIARFADAA